MTPRPDSLARRYVADTGLPLDAVMGLFVLQNAPDHPHAMERLTGPERAELAALTDNLDRVMGWVTVLSLEPARRTRRPALIPADEAAMLRQALAIDALIADPRAVRINDGAGVDVWRSALVISPTLAAWDARRTAILARCILTADERQARITAALTRKDGTVAVTPADWCAAHGADVAALYHAVLAEWWQRGPREKERTLPPVVRVGTAALTTYTADKAQVKRATRKNRLTTSDRVDEIRRQFLASDFRGLRTYEKLVLVSLANLAWDEGLLDGLPEAASGKRIIDPDSLTKETEPTRLRFRFPGFTEIAERVGAPRDADGRIPQHYKESFERAFNKLTTEARWIPEPVRVYDKTRREWDEHLLVRQTLWVETETLVGENGPTEMWVELHAAAATSMLASWNEYPALLEQYETARKQIGARQLRDDFVACEDYLTVLRNANEAHARTEEPTDGATEGDRVVWADVSKALLWEKMGWDKEAKHRGKKHANKLERDALAFCEARGLLVSWRERPGKKGPVLDFELRGSRHADLTQGTLFLPGGNE